MANLNLKVARIPAGPTCKELIESLKEITDSDYNGDNGEEYFIYDSKMSDLEFKIRELYKAHINTTELIKAVIEDNYNHPYYATYEYHIEDITHDFYLAIVASVAR